MPGSHGGGSHSSGGGFHSSGSGGSSHTFSSKHTFPGAKKYTYTNRYGRTCFFYSSVVPTRRSVVSCIIGPILFMLFALVFGALLISSLFPSPLASEACKKTDFYIDDFAEVFEDTSSLEGSLEAFYTKTGVQPYVYTNTKAFLISEGFSYSEAGVEDFAYEMYVRTFKDEGHYAVCLIYQDSENYIWCDMSGDDTVTVVTDKLFSLFQTTLQNELDDLSTPFEKDFEVAFSKITELALTRQAMDLSGPIVGSLVMLGVFVFGAVALVGSLKSRRQINDYMDYQKKSTYKVNGEEYNKDDFNNF